MSFYYAAVSNVSKRKEGRAEQSEKELRKWTGCHSCNPLSDGTQQRFHVTKRFIDVRRLLNMISLFSNGTHFHLNPGGGLMAHVKLKMTSSFLEDLHAQEGRF